MSSNYSPFNPRNAQFKGVRSSWDMYRTYDFLTDPTKARKALVTCQEKGEVMCVNHGSGKRLHFCEGRKGVPPEI